MEKMKEKMKREMKRNERIFFSKKFSRPSDPPDESAQTVSKKNSFRTNYSSIFLRKFRIWPCFQLFTWFEFDFSGRAKNWENVPGCTGNSLPSRPKLRDLSEDQNNKCPCRRRSGGAVLRAENFGDLITADHKVLSEGCESRNSDRYGVVVQDLATQWIQGYPCKTKNSQETQRSLQKFLEPDWKP